MSCITWPCISGRGEQYFGRGDLHNALTDRMGASINVVDDKLDDVVVYQNVWIGVHTIHLGIGRIFTNRQGSRKSRHLW